jgi:hypothetical protein
MGILQLKQTSSLPPGVNDAECCAAYRGIEAEWQVWEGFQSVMIFLCFIGFLA